MNNFWKKLNLPILALAPMYDITDTAFRQVIAHCGKPSVFFTEFVSVDGLTHPKSQERMINYFFRFNEIERPLVAQLWGNNPEKFYQSALLLKNLSFDGIDINMGCPDKAVVKAGSGSALILNPSLAKEIIRKTKEAGLPVSVKTRIGFDKKITKEWISHLLETNPAAITVHGRTMKEMSKVPADWNAIKEAKELAKGTETLILGNGDVRSLEEAMGKVKNYGVDGVMFGRGIFGNPWLFNPNSKIEEISPRKKLEVLSKHIDIFDEYFPAIKLASTKKSLKNFNMIKKHVKSYVSGFNGSKEVRSKLMATKNGEEMKNIINEIESGSMNYRELLN